jgi:hypothetical protein
MTPRTRSGRINIELGPLKARWLGYCATHGVTPSEGFRQIVKKLTAGGKAPIPERGESEQGNRIVRKVIRLTAEENDRVGTHARADGYSASRWLVALIRAHVYDAPQLGQVELAALAKSNLVLLAIGRNLNQIAKAMHVAGGSVSAGRRVPDERIAELRTHINEHTQLVTKVLAENVRRWSRS